LIRWNRRRPYGGGWWSTVAWRNRRRHSSFDRCSHALLSQSVLDASDNCYWYYNVTMQLVMAAAASVIWSSIVESFSRPPSLEL